MENPSLLHSTNGAAELEDSSKTELSGVDSKCLECSKPRYSVEMEDTSCNKARNIDTNPVLSLSSSRAYEIDGNELLPRKPRDTLVGKTRQSDQIARPSRLDCNVVPELLTPDRALGSHKLPPAETSEAGSKLLKSDMDETTNRTATKHTSIFEPTIEKVFDSPDIGLDASKHTIADLEIDPAHTSYSSKSVRQAWSLRTPEELVKETHEQARSLNNAWAKTLTSMPQFRHLNSRLYRTSVFESGLDSLLVCLEGRIPSSFEGVFSMMHIVLSFAYILHSHESMTFPWDTLFEDIFKWRHAITNEDDSILYGKVAHALWPSEKTMALHKTLDLSRSSSPNSDNQKNKKRCGVYLHESPFCACQTEPLSSLGHQKTHLKDLLSKGSVIKLCTRYLDGNSKQSGVLFRAEMKHRIRKF
ncbi:MAG: hypothetical protein Q9167_002866 [Letrouitia subvulpina]